MAHFLTLLKLDLQTRQPSVFPFLSLLLGKMDAAPLQHFKNHVSAETQKTKEMLSLAYHSSWLTVSCWHTPGNTHFKFPHLLIMDTGVFL